MAVAVVHQGLPFFGPGEVVGSAVRRFERPGLLGERPLIGMKAGFVLALQPEQGGQQRGLLAFDVGKERRDVLDPGGDALRGEDRDVEVVAFARNALPVVGVQRQFAIAERRKHPDAVACRPPQEIEHVLHVGFVERLGRLILPGDARIDVAAPDDENAHGVVAALAQGAEHGLGAIRVVAGFGGFRIRVESRMVAVACALCGTEADVVEAGNKKRPLGVLEKELRLFFASPDRNPLQWFELMGQDKPGPVGCECGEAAKQGAPEQAGSKLHQG